jgi:hypothetical protein
VRPRTNCSLPRKRTKTLKASETRLEGELSDKEESETRVEGELTAAEEKEIEDRIKEDLYEAEAV